MRSLIALLSASLCLIRIFFFKPDHKPLLKNSLVDPHCHRIVIGFMRLIYKIFPSLSSDEPYFLQYKPYQITYSYLNSSGYFIPLHSVCVYLFRVPFPLICHQIHAVLHPSPLFKIFWQLLTFIIL